jgi:hypothetical protein
MTRWLRLLWAHRGLAISWNREYPSVRFVEGKLSIFSDRNVHNEAYLKEFHTMKRDTDTEDIRHIGLAGDRNNNRMERFNGELRQREKVMRSPKRPDTQILAGYQICHNYVRPHETLNGGTPSEAAGLKVGGEDEWLTLIRNAS